jgi:hypothetical protein
MESVIRARACSDNRRTRFLCQHPTAATTRAKRPRQPACQSRTPRYAVVMAQADVESDGPVLLIVCGFHKARMARGGAIVAAERIEDIEGRQERVSAAWELADSMASRLLMFSEAREKGTALAQLDIDASTLHGMIHDLWKECRGT